MGEAKQSQAPIIIRRPKTGHAGHHGGAWKVAYADFVTAMMAFFLVMWLCAQTPSVKQGVAGYFRDPLGHADAVGNSAVLDGSAAILPPDVAPPPPPSDREREEREEQERLESKLRDILDALDEIPGMSELAGQIEVEITDEGLRIQLMESEQATFFDLGSAHLSEKGVAALGAIARIIGPFGHNVVVEGHTDSRPFADGDGYTNWELSADRANAARRVLEGGGLDVGRLRAIRGYAATRPRFPESTDDPGNRRIAVIVQKRSAQTGG